jgi:hypothetical protein
MKMEPIHKKPRKDVVRMGNRDFEKSIRARRRRNFEMKKWIESYYDRIEYEK